MTGEPALDAVPRSVRRFAGGCLVVSAAIFGSHAFHASYLYKSRTLTIVCAVLAVLALACLKLPPAARVKVALSVLPSLLVVHAFELALAWRSPGPATAAFRAGRSWDGRPMADVMHDLRAEGRDAWPSARPRLLYKKRHRGLPIGGREELPLGGVSGATTILCNESGTWAVYDADEHGFNNPRGLWSGEVELALVGDSFTQGACVGPQHNAAAKLRTRHPATLNLGMLGNGPLLELAGIAEFLTVEKPKEVLWLYFRNDLSDLDFEKTSRLLRRYVDEDGFRVGLPEHQPAVDDALKKAISELEMEAAWWPRRFGAVGLTRKNTPVWLQDLVMGEHNSSLSAVLRLDHLVAAGAGLATSGGGGDPEAHSAANPPDLALFQRVLEKARALTASWGGTLRFVYLPDFWPPGAEGKQDHPDRAGVLEVVHKVGLPLIDVHAAFQKRADQRSLLYFRQSHCNEAGYDAVGQVILDALDAPGSPP